VVFVVKIRQIIHIPLTELPMPYPNLMGRYTIVN
jgi:hypothetical protein